MRQINSLCFSLCCWQTAFWWEQREFFIFDKGFLNCSSGKRFIYVKDDIIAIIWSFPHMSWVTKVNFVVLFCSAQYLDLTLRIGKNCAIIGKHLCRMEEKINRIMEVNGWFCGGGDDFWRMLAAYCGRNGLNDFRQWDRSENLTVVL